MKKIESVKQNYEDSVSGTGVKLEYRVTTVGGVVESVFGTAKKGMATVAFISYEKGADRMHISYEPFSATTLKEKKAIASKAIANIDELTAAEETEKTE